ncbi:hypothetical protein LUZ60_013338 [Juncus effusus]|nr:hypothetical protein LUZ60_013338 [Juncus effusus]
MATRQSGDGLASQVAAMSKPQLYDLMSQMKVLIEQNQDKARQILIDNPVLTRTLFQAQIMLGMVQPPKVMPNIQQVISQTELSKPTEPDPLPLPPPPAVQPKPQTLIHQQQPNFNNPQYLTPPPPSAPPPLQLSTPQLSGPINPQLSGPNNPQLAAPQFNMQSTHFNQPPPPMPHQQGRMQQFPNQMAPHQQMMMSNNSMGFQGGAQPQQMMPPPPQPPMYHPGGIPQSSFPQVQPPLPSQPSPRQLYQGGAHMNTEYGGMPMQSDRPGPPWTTSGQMPGPPPPFMPGQQQMAPRPPQLTQDMEKNLLQQVMSLTPDQINMLAPDQRHQVLQLQEMLSRN